MGKRRGFNVFQDDDNSDDDKDDFMKYVKEKSDQSRKKARDGSTHTRVAQIEISQEEPASVDASNTKETSLGSKYMGQLLESKKRRELDRAHAQSLKVRLEKELGSHHNTTELITKGYKQKKEEYEKADELAEDEDNRESMEFQNHAPASEGVALKMLITSPSKEDHHSSLGSNENHSKLPKLTHYSNDVYINKSLLNNPGIRESLNYVDTIRKRECVKKFLGSRKTDQDINALIKQYWERRNGTKK